VKKKFFRQKKFVERKKNFSAGETNFFVKKNSWREKKFFRRKKFVERKKISRQEKNFFRRKKFVERKKISRQEKNSSIHPNALSDAPYLPPKRSQLPARAAREHALGGDPSRGPPEGLQNDPPEKGPGRPSGGPKTPPGVLY